MSQTLDKEAHKAGTEAPVTLNELMDVLKMSPPTLRALIKSGKIRSHLVGQRKTFFFLSEVFEDIKKL